MEGKAVPPDRDAPAWCLLQPELSEYKLRALGPDFLIISPPKTGSTWLADNLRCHPAIFIPDVKEVKYFSSYCKWFDLSWYLDHFAAGGGRMKGEASPSYALLPVERIRLIRHLLPDVKLIFLMRAPVGRAWSHAKHNYRYREVNFAGCAAPFEAIAEPMWRENFTHEWPLANSDYLGQLRRWLSVFPQEQLYVGFFESIANAPHALLRDIFAFLGVPAEVDFASFPVEETVLPGLRGELSPALAGILQGLLHDRTRELASFLRERFGLQVPVEWEASLAPGTSQEGADSLRPQAAAVFSREFDDRYLSWVVEQEAAFASSPRQVVEGYRGYNLIYYRGRFYALDQSLGEVCLTKADEAELRDYQERGSCCIAPSLSEVKADVDGQVFDRYQARLRVIDSLQAELRDTREQFAGQITGLSRTLDQIDGDLRRTGEALRRVEAELVRLVPWYIAVARVVRKAWRRLRASR